MIIELKKNQPFKPSRFFRDNAKIFYPLLAICIVACYFFIDKPFALFFASSRSDWQDILSLLNNLMNPYLSLLILPSLFFFIRFVQRRDRKSKKIWCLCFATAIPLLATSILNVLIGRASPDWLILHQEMTIRLFQWNPSFHSFPSATSCNIGALAAACCYLYPKKASKFFCGGIALGLVPALLGACFLSDALAGISVGMILARIVYKTMRREMSFS